MYRRRASLLLVGLIALPALTGCAPELDEDRLAEAIGTAPAAIEGGYPDHETTHAVGMVHVGNFGIGACSGTLIAPNVVLTAHHCVSSTSAQGVQCSLTSFGSIYGPEELLVTTHQSFPNNLNGYHTVAEIHIPPDGPLLCGRDQAIVILADPIGPEEAIPASPRVDEPLTREAYYAVGYGQQFDSDNAPSGERIRRDDLMVDCVGDDCGMPTTLKTSEWRGDTGMCSGDSGGPAFDMLHRVVGVASRGAAGCELPVYGDVYSWGGWIKEITTYAAGLMGSEPPPWATGWPTDPAYSQPVGGTCTVAEQCPSNICLNGNCTRLCNEASPCPDGYECNADGFCAKVAPPPPADDDDDSSSTVSGCAFGDQDPTKPIPWKTAPLMLLGALALYVRRRRLG